MDPFLDGFMGCLWWHWVCGLRSVCLWVVYSGVLHGGCWVLCALLILFLLSNSHYEKYVGIVILILVMALSFYWA